jgi:hypothetical protein
MSLIVKIADESDSKTWNEAIKESPHGTLFHTWEWLKIAEKQTHSTLYPLMCYRGTTLAAIYPLFIMRKGFVNIALSPPPKAYLLYLGPVIVGYEGLKQDKKESIYIQIQEEVDRYIFSELNCKYARIRSSPLLLDSRPLRWAGYGVEPLYTYRIDLRQGAQSVWERFDRKLRVDINKTQREGVKVEEGGKEDLDFIRNSVATRMKEQGLKTSDYQQYLCDLFDRLHPEYLRVFTASYQGERIGGMIALCYKGIMHLWVGVPKSTIPGISPNDLVQWEAITWACDNGFQYYELMDAGNDPRLRHFKSKYNPDLVIWYSAERHYSYMHKIIMSVLKR